jgi:hypothetical protein
MNADTPGNKGPMMGVRGHDVFTLGVTLYLRYGQGL